MSDIHNTPSVLTNFGNKDLGANFSNEKNGSEAGYYAPAEEEYDHDYQQYRPDRSKELLASLDSLAYLNKSVVKRNTTNPIVASKRDKKDENKKDEEKDKKEE